MADLGNKPSTVALHTAKLTIDTFCVNSAFLCQQDTEETRGMAKKAKKAASKAKQYRLNLYFAEDINTRIEAWRRAPGRPVLYTKAAAARDLIVRGLDAEEKGQRR